jgi:CheY-like chemotaxis protein
MAGSCIGLPAPARLASHEGKAELTDALPDAPTVVVADDEPEVRALFVAGLQPAGYRILEAADGDAAWALVRAHRPALVVSDAAMPGRSGPELARAIKADPGLTPTYVIIVSGTVAPAELEAIRTCGADLFLSKPVSLRALAQAVAAGLRQRGPA